MMIGLLQKFLVRQRVWMLVGLCLIGITALAVFVIEKAHRQYLELKQTEYIKLTQSAIKVLEHYHSLTVSGELETVQARRLAKRAINTMALDGRNYFYMYNSEHELLISHPFLPETSIYPDDTPEELAESIEVSREAMITAGNNRGWSYPSYTPLAVLADQHENATGFFEYYFYLWGEEKTPIVQRVSDTDIPAFAERKLAYAMPFQPWNWTVITGIYRADEEAAFLNWVRDMVIVSAIILAVIFAFALVISKSITRPLYNIVELMDDIAKGTGDLTRRLDASGRNELARLADGFNQFAEKISGIISCVAVENAVILGLSKDMSENMSQAVARSDRQLSETDQLAQASKDLSESVDNVTDRAVATVQSARATEQSMVDARSTMQKSIESIQALSNSLTVTQDRVSSMEAYSKQVSSVLDVIVTIAEQTNLLALNAAIEAARAGDQGRGFAVVADEVRTLAQRTQTSAAEIDEIISNLQSGTQSVVEAMGDGLSHSQTCVESATQANHVFKDMLTHVQDITEMNQQIASSVEQQSQVAGRILDISHNIAEGSQENLKDVNINLETTNKLTADAEQLDALISSFRYHSE